MNKKLILSISLLIIYLNIALAQNKIDGHPAWIMQGNIYEVNTRQYTPQGTFNAFSKHLPRLKKMGVQTLWFMPINPISKKDRKRSESELGSYYAVSDYRKINPEYGSMNDWKSLVKKAQSMGFKVIIDWVPTHSGADHYWLNQNNDFYVKDKDGNPISQYDWSDTRKLNYNNPILVDSMIDCMKFWLKTCNIDGFRCDVAGEVPDEFWSKCIVELKKEKEDIFMLAEGDRPSLHNAGFDATYTWEDFSAMKKIASGETNATALDSVIEKHQKTFVNNAIRMYFTSNHDENSWNKADWLTMPGEIHAPFAVLTQTLKRTVPLIYGGQEEPFLDSLKFFTKDTITFGKYRRAKFYTTLLNLRKNNKFLSANASYTKLVSTNDKAIFAFTRQKDDNKIVVITNLSNKQQNFIIVNEEINGLAKEIFTNKSKVLRANEKISIKPWGYFIFKYN